VIKNTGLELIEHEVLTDLTVSFSLHLLAFRHKGKLSEIKRSDCTLANVLLARGSVGQTDSGAWAVNSH